MEQVPVQQQFVVATPQDGGGGAGGGGNEPRPPQGAEDGRSTSASDGLPSPEGIGGKPATRTEAVLERARRALQHSRTHQRVPARPFGGADDATTSCVASPGAASASPLEAPLPPLATVTVPVQGPPLAMAVPIQGNSSVADKPVAVASPARVLGTSYVPALGPCGSPLETLLDSQFASTAPLDTPVGSGSNLAGTRVRNAVESVSRAEAILRRAKDALQRAQAPGSRTTSRMNSRLQSPILSATTSRAATPPPASPAHGTYGRRQPSPVAIESSASIAWSKLADYAATPSAQLPPSDFVQPAAAPSGHVPPDVAAASASASVAQSKQADSAVPPPAQLPLTCPAEQAAVQSGHMPPSVLADQRDRSCAQVTSSDLVADAAAAPSAREPDTAGVPPDQVRPSNSADQEAESAVPVVVPNEAAQVGAPTAVVPPSQLTDAALSVSVPPWADGTRATAAPPQLQMMMEPARPIVEQQLNEPHKPQELKSTAAVDEPQLQLPQPPAGYVYSLTQVPNTPEGKGVGKGGKGVAPAPPPPPAQKPRGKGGPPVPKVGPPPKGPELNDGQDKSQSATSADGSSVNAPFHRKLYWKALEIDDAEGTIFSELERDRHGKAMTFDREALTRMFEGEKEKSAALTRRSTTMLDRVHVKTQGVKILSDHRARNIAIVLRTLPVSTKDLTRVMRQLCWEEKELTTDDLEQVLVIIPTKEEAEMLREYRGSEERRTLRDVEQMVMPFVTLSRCAARLRLICIARSSRSQFKATQQALASIRSCCQAIQRSPLLREVMLLALDLGNYINHGDSNKGAKAISVGSLLTLKDFKTGRMSSLHFLCATMLRMQPDLNVAEGLAKELKPVVTASKLQVQNLMAGMRAFRRDTETVTLECKTYLHEYETASAAEEELAADGEQLDDGELEEYEAASLTSSFGEHEAIDQDAARFVEDVMKIRGSANRRLQCMRRVQEKLMKHLQDKMELTAGDVHAVLRFCGVTGTKAKEVPVEFEVLTGQLAEFIRVFRSHWDEVKADMSSYEQLFRAGGGKGRRSGPGASGSGRAIGSGGSPPPVARSHTWR